MLDVLRKRKRSWVIIFLIGIITLVFVLFYGAGPNLDQSRQDSLARVNGEAISQREFEISYQRLLEFYRNLFKGKLTPETIQALNLRGVILDQLIQKTLLLQEARRLGLQATNAELIDAIAGNPNFQVNGRFNKDRYLRVLRTRRLTPGRFEVEQSEQLTIQKLYDIVQDSSLVSDAEVEDRYRLEQEKIALYFIRLQAKDFLPQARVTSEEVKTYYERNKETVREPARVQVEYSTYPFAHFSSSVQVSEKEIEDYYNLYRDTQFHQPKTAHLRQILFRIPDGADLQQIKKIRTKAEGVLQQAQAGGDFTLLAKKFSDDPSGAQGGDMGFFTKGQMLPQLDKVAFALKKGEVSNVVETPLGYHILKVEETTGEKTTSLKEATEEIVRAIKANRGRTDAGNAADADREKAISGTELSILAKQRGIPLTLSPWFSRSEVLPKLGSVEEFNKTAFSLVSGEISPVIEGPRAYYLLKLKNRKKSFVPPLDGVRGELEKKLRDVKAFKLASQKAELLLTQLKKEKDIKSIAQKYNLSVEETGWFLRNAPQLPKIGPLNEVKPGELPLTTAQSVPKRIYTQTKAVYLLAFKGTQGADMKRFGKEKKQLKEQALKEKRKRALQKFVEDLKAKADIKL
ncbi:MAG: SurA N-terminal domain-containing protein [Candidatus Binatia bacterium]